MLPDGERKSPPVAVCMGTSLKLLAGVGADDVGCPVEPLDAVGEGLAVVVAAAVGDAARDFAPDAVDVAVAEASPEADEPGSCELHPAMSTPATARVAPVSNVRRALFQAILLHPL
jgi:hypothetical protein